MNTFYLFSPQYPRPHAVLSITYLGKKFDMTDIIIEVSKTIASGTRRLIMQLLYYIAFQH